MSALAEILDGLSGVAVVREKLDETAGRLDRLADGLLHHERRIASLEAASRAWPGNVPPGDDWPGSCTKLMMNRVFAS